MKFLKGIIYKVQASSKGKTSQRKIDMNHNLFVIKMITASMVHDISSSIKEVLSSHMFMGKVNSA